MSYARFRFLPKMGTESAFKERRPAPDRCTQAAKPRP